MFGTGAGREWAGVRVCSRIHVYKDACVRVCVYTACIMCADMHVAGMCAVHAWCMCACMQCIGHVCEYVRECMAGVYMCACVCAVHRARVCVVFVRVCGCALVVCTCVCVCVCVLGWLCASRVQQS